jgi:LMBR1 domain-containing protein 1
LLPLDVANQKDSYFSAGLPIEKITLALLTSSILMITVLLPFTMFYYEGEDSGEDGEAVNSPIGQCGYAFQYIIPTLLFLGFAVGGMYYAGLGYAQVSTVYLQSPLFETTGLEADSLEGYYIFDFYCNSKKLGQSLTLTPKFPDAKTTFIPNIVGNTGNSDFGCQNLASQNEFTPVFHY